MSESKEDRRKLSHVLEKFMLVVKELLELRLLGDPVLHEKAKDVQDNEDCSRTTDMLKNTLLKYRDITGLGRGIAAPQVGVSKKIFVAYIDDKFQVYI